MPGNADFRPLMKQIMIYSPGVLLSAVITLGSGAIFTRLFDPNAYGMYSLALSAVNFTTTVSAQWLQQSINRYIPSSNDLIDKQNLKDTVVVGIVSTFILQVLLSIIGYYPFFLWTGMSWSPYYFAAVPSVLSSTLFLPLLTVLQAEGRSTSYVRYNLANNVLKITFGLMFIYLVFRSAYFILWGASLGTFILVPFLLKSVGVHLRTSFKSHIGKLGEYLRYGVPMIGWFIAANILSVSDRFVVQTFHGAKEVGIYSASYSLISGAVGLVASPLLLAVHPFLMKAWGSGHKQEVTRYLGLAIEIFTIFALLLTCLTWIFDRDIALLFLGTKFTSGYAVMPVVVAGILAWYFGLYAHKPLEFKERTRLMLGLSSLAAVTNLGLNVVFVPKFGYMASAYITLFSYLLYALAVSFIGRRILKWGMKWNRIIRNGTIILVFTGSIWMVRHSLSYELGLVIAVLLVICLIGVIGIFGGYAGEFRLYGRVRELPHNG